MLKWPVSQEYHYRWWTKDLLWQCSIPHRLRFVKEKLWVWWDYHGIIHFEFLNCSQILNGILYSQQLQCVYENLRKLLTLIIKNHAGKTIGFRLVCSIIFTRSCTKWFSSFSFFTKWSEWQKTCWAWNQLNFTREESTSHLINGKSWFKIMADILLIEINTLFNYS